MRNLISWCNFAILRALGKNVFQCPTIEREEKKESMDSGHVARIGERREGGEGRELREGGGHKRG